MNVTALETTSTPLTVVLNVTDAVFPAVFAAEVTEQYEAPVEVDAEHVPDAITVESEETTVGVTLFTGFPVLSVTNRFTADVVDPAVLPSAAPAVEARFNTWVATILFAEPKNVTERVAV